MINYCEIVQSKFYPGNKTSSYSMTFSRYDGSPPNPSAVSATPYGGVHHPRKHRSGYFLERSPRGGQFIPLVLFPCTEKCCTQYGLYGYQRIRHLGRPKP